MLAALGPINSITSRIIKCAIEVHRTLGPGLLEAIYFACLLYELNREGLRVECERAYPVVYKGVTMACVYRIDMIVEGIVVIELKCVEKLLGVHSAQLLSEMKVAGLPVGLLLNFKVPVMKEGITRLLNKEAMEKLEP